MRGKKKVIVTDMETGEHADHLVPMGKHIIVGEGDILDRGDQITEGPVLPTISSKPVAHKLCRSTSSTRCSGLPLQGVEINDKHIEIIIRQMLRKVKITEPGDTEFLWGDQIERTTFKKPTKKSLSKVVSRRGRACSPWYHQGLA